MALSPESFERLMNWLHPNRDEAGQEYQRIRTLLIRKFQAQGCSSPDRLADMTMDRAAQILTPEKIANWVGEKERYFYRVAYYILKEERDKSQETQMSEDFDIADSDKESDLEAKSQCLEKCLQELSADNRVLIDKYYRGERSTKIKNRRELARDRKVDLARLRVQVHRVRKDLRKCIERCLDKAAQSRPSLQM